MVARCDLRGSLLATPILFRQFSVLAFAASIGLTSLVEHLEFLIPIYGFALLCALVAFGTAKKLQPLPLLISCWLASILLNPLWSVWPAVSWWTSIIIALPPLGFLAGSNLIISSKSWRYTEWTIYLIGGFTCGWIALEFWHSGGQRSDGPLLDANAAGAVTYLLLLPLLGSYLATSSLVTGLQSARIFLIALLSFSLFATASRGAIGVFALALASVFAVTAIKTRYKKPYIQRIAIASTTIIGTLALNLTVSDALLTRNIPSLARISTDADASIQHRLLIWRSTLDMYLDEPWLGSGLGSFALRYPSFRSPDETSSSGDLAHNDYLQMLAEGGPVLLFGLCIFAGWAAYSLFNLFFCQKNTESKLLVEKAGYAAALFAGSLHATVNFIFYVPSIAVLMAIWAARATHDKNNCKYTENRLFASKQSRLIFLAGIAGLILLVSNAYSSNLLHPRHLTPSDYATNSDRYFKALLISRLIPFDYISMLYLIQSETQEAINWGVNQGGRAWAEMALSDIKELRERKKYDCLAEETEAVLWYLFDLKPSDRSAEGGPLALLDAATKKYPLCRSLYKTAGLIAIEEKKYSDGIAIAGRILEWLKIGAKDTAPTLDALEVLADLYLRNGQLRSADYYARIVLTNDGARPKAKAIVQEVQRRLAEKSN